MHTKFTQPTKTGTGERVKQNDYFREEQMGEFEGREAGGRQGGEGGPNEREMKCDGTSGEKNRHCSLESISTHAPTAFTQPYYLQDVKVLLFM